MFYIYFYFFLSLFLLNGRGPCWMWPPHAHAHWFIYRNDSPVSGGRTTAKLIMAVCHHLIFVSHTCTKSDTQSSTSLLYIFLPVCNSRFFTAFWMATFLLPFVSYCRSFVVDIFCAIVNATGNHIFFWSYEDWCQ